MNRSIGTLLATIAGLSAGFAFGLLLSPKSGKENRDWVTKHTGDAKNWVEGKGSKLVQESEQKLNRISKGVKEVIPDLYEATASIHFDEEELEENV